MDRKEFNEILLQKMNDEWSNFRPFVCEGHPFDCSVMILGVNPASKMDFNFNSFWDASSGFQKAKWEKEYLASRENGKSSKTRRGIETINSEITPLKTFETNIYAYPTKNVKELKAVFNNDPTLKTLASRPFQWFLENLTDLKVVLIHGSDAAKAFNEYYPSNLFKSELNGLPFSCNEIVDLPNKKIVFTQHLSYQTSIEKWKQIGKGIYNIL